MKSVSFDAKSVLIDGRRELLLSGAIHYLRSTPAMWPDLMRRSKDAGLNAIETITFWGQHEPVRGRYDIKFARASFAPQETPSPSGASINSAAAASLPRRRRP